MKMPKKVKKYCPHCKKQTEMEVVQVKKKQRSGMRAGDRRAERQRKGYGEHGRYSRKPVPEYKRKSKTVKKLDLRYKCGVCKKQVVQKQGTRAKRFELVK